jgi:hypothetical protein
MVSAVAQHLQTTPATNGYPCLTTGRKARPEETGKAGQTSSSPIPTAWPIKIKQQPPRNQGSIRGSRLSWERAQRIADPLPAEDPNRTAMRITPRTMLCGIAWRTQMDVAGDRFEELRELCAAAGDKVSLAIAMAGLVLDRTLHGRVREASQLASETWILVESIGDATLTVGLPVPMLYTKAHSGDWCDVLRWSQRLIDMADGDPSKGNFMVGCPLALAVAARAAARYCPGRPGWRDDLRHGLAMSRSTDAMSYATVVAWVYGAGIPLGVLAADDRALCEIEDALQIAERSGDDVALSNARMTLGVALAHRQETADRDREQQVLAKVSQVLRRPGYNLCDLPIVEVYLARESARRGESDVAIPLMRAAVDQMVREGQLLGWGPLPRPVFWWRLCSSAAPKMSGPKPWPRLCG